MILHRHVKQERSKHNFPQTLLYLIQEFVRTDYMSNDENITNKENNIITNHQYKVNVSIKFAFE